MLALRRHSLLLPRRAADAAVHRQRRRASVARPSTRWERGARRPLRWGTPSTSSGAAAARRGGGGTIGVLKRCALLLLGAVGGGRGGGYRTTNNAWRDAADVAVQIRKLINTDGFVIASSAFVVSIGITNVISTFLDLMLEHLGFHQHTIGIIGAAFQVAIMVGSLLFGSYVDRTKKYVTATVFCFIASFFFLSGASEGLHGNGLVVCILCVGFFVGPIHRSPRRSPSRCVRGARVRGMVQDDGMVGWWLLCLCWSTLVFDFFCDIFVPKRLCWRSAGHLPGRQNAIVAVQQVFSNLFSALLVPLSNRVAPHHRVQHPHRLPAALHLRRRRPVLHLHRSTAAPHGRDRRALEHHRGTQRPQRPRRISHQGNSDDDEDTEVGEAGGPEQWLVSLVGRLDGMSPRVRS